MADSLTMSAEIAALLRRLETHHGVRILYACESGSHAWGFASPDSDFDIRSINFWGRGFFYPNSGAAATTRKTSCTR